jgi:D5 N terminal like
VRREDDRRFAGLARAREAKAMPRPCTELLGGRRACRRASYAGPCAPGGGARAPLPAAVRPLLAMGQTGGIRCREDLLHEVAKVERELWMGVSVKRAVTVEDVYRGEGERYRRVRTVPHTEVDVAEAVRELDGRLSYETLCFETGADKYETYVATAGGIWEEQRGRGAIMESIQNVRRRLHEVVIEPLTDVITTLRLEEEESETKRKRAEVELSHMLWIYTKLGSSTFCRAVAICIQQRLSAHARMMGRSAEQFDTRRNCIGFTDGVYDFEKREFVRGSAARDYMLTRTVGYAYEEVESVSAEDKEEFSKFLAQVHPEASNREYLLVRLRNAARKSNDQIILIHYNVSGSNGKSTLFSLLRRTFGSLMVTCNPSLLVAPTVNNPNAANEELYSIKGASIVLMTEPSSKSKLSAAFIKRLTGDDEQSARKNYGSKSTFVFSGLANVLCNKIPQIDDMDGGMERRLRCLPYTSVFVEASKFDATNRFDTTNMFVMDRTIAQRFETWRYCLMREILDAPDSCADPPDVMEHTRNLVARESIYRRFAADCFRCTSDSSGVKLRDAWSAWKRYASERAIAAGQYATFAEEMEVILGRRVHKSGSQRSKWRGWRLVEPEVDASSSAEEEDG